MFKIGDLVTRNSYNNDVVFKIIDIKDDVYYLKGVNVRLCADSDYDDLVGYTEEAEEENDDFFLNTNKYQSLDRSEYFYLPGKVLHIDSDRDYLDKCLKFYKKNKAKAYGIYEEENKVSANIELYNPDILVITGHDAYYRKRKDRNKYKNSTNFINSVKEARKYEKSHEKLIIIAGACQSDYEELIKAASCIYQLSDLRCCPEVLVGCNRGNHCVSDPDSLGYFQQKTGAYPKDLYTDFCYTGIAGAD